MNVWIFQDKPGTDLTTALATSARDSWWWNVDRYVRDTTEPHIRPGDIALLWQPYLDPQHPAGVYAYAKVVKGPYEQNNEKTRWRVDLHITEVLKEPITRDAIRKTRNPTLNAMLIMRMPAGHIVFPVSAEQWAALQQLHAS